MAKYTITNRTAQTNNTEAVNVEITPDMLELMTNEQRVVVMYYLAGQSFKAIAQHLDLAEMSVRTRFQRGMKAALEGRQAKQRGDTNNNIGGLTDEQVKRLELLAVLGSVQKVADHLGLNNQMTVRSSLNRAAEKMGCTDEYGKPQIWVALKKYLAARDNAAREAGKVIKIDGKEVIINNNNE